MKLKEYIDNLNKLVEKHPEALEIEKTIAYLLLKELEEYEFFTVPENCLDSFEKFDNWLTSPREEDNER